MIKNSKRINLICQFVDKKIIAEIGADHGLISKNLFKKNKVDFAYLTDISAKSLEKAKLNFLKFKTNSTMFFVGDGLEPLQKNKVFDDLEIIVAGMGAKEIIKILKQDKNLFYKNFVLQPQKNIVELRKFLINNNFTILKDAMVKDQKIYYNVLKVKRGYQNLSQLEILFGKDNLINPNKDFKSFLNEETKKFKKIFSDNKSKQVKNKLKLLKQVKMVIKQKGEILSV